MQLNDNESDVSNQFYTNAIKLAHTLAHTHVHTHTSSYIIDEAQMYVNVVHIQGYWLKCNFPSAMKLHNLHEFTSWLCVRSGRFPIEEVIIISMPLQAVTRDQTNPKHLFILFISMCMCYSTNSCNYLPCPYVWAKCIETW